MLNLHDLEARHRKYKLKSYIPYALIAVLILFSIIALILYDDKTEITSIKKIEHEQKVQIIKQKLDINNSKIISPIIEEKIKKLIRIEKKEQVIQIIEPIAEEKKTRLSPSLDFLKNMQPTDVHTYENKNENIIQKNTNAIKIKKVTQEKIIEKVIEEPIEEEPVLIINKKSSIKIRRNNEIDEIKHVIKRFKTNNNPALSLFVAKKYYQIGKYRKAYNYALITNQINNNIEASWIIFTKSLIKLGEKDMAIKTLKKYIDHSHSSQAKILLDEIQSGKFK